MVKMLSKQGAQGAQHFPPNDLAINGGKRQESAHSNEEIDIGYTSDEMVGYPARQRR
jgi:hypothetical protein